MDSHPGTEITLHLEIVPEETQKAFAFLARQTWLKDSGWYLAGGTALALQVGHRRSVDLDFFTRQAEFDSTEVLSRLAPNPEWRTDINKVNTIYGRLFDAKVSFIAYPFFVPKEEPVASGSIVILKPTDIAVMKIIALSQRGKKRDFFDAYWLAQHIEPLEKTIKRLKVQYPSVAHDYHHILKSLVYFEDAEGDPDPDILFNATWDEVKDFFNRRIPLIADRLIGLGV